MVMAPVWRGLSIAAAVLVVAQPAFAADLAVKAPPPAAVAVNWTGLYFGGEISGLYTSARHMQPLTPGLSATSIGSVDPRPAYGLYGGFNYQFTSWAVLGVEYNYTRLSGASYRELGPALDPLQQARHIDALTGRLGILFRPDTMVYGKAGPARMEVLAFDGFALTPSPRTLRGVQAGFGIESMVLPNVAVRAEATYTYADRLLSLNQGGDLYRPAFVMFSVGAAYKFDIPGGWGVPATVAAPVATRWPLITKAPPREPAVAATNWTGIEAGGFLSVNGNKVIFNDTMAGEQGPYTNLNAGGGWFAGANVQFQRVVAGFEFSGNYESANFNTAAGSGGLVTNFHRFAQISQVLAMTARVGFLTTPDTLLYVKGGPAQLRMTTDPNFFTAIAPNVTGARSYAGYEGGVGAETYVLPRVSVRVEGLYMRTANSVTLNGTVPREITLQPSVVAATIGVALHL